MAKALLGHIGSVPDMRLVAEVRRLQLRVKELEAELAEAQTAHLLEHSLSISEPEPAYS